MDEMTEKQEEATRIIEAIGTTTLNECYVPVINLVCPFCGGSPVEKISGENHCPYCDKYW